MKSKIKLIVTLSVVALSLYIPKTYAALSQETLTQEICQLMDQAQKAEQYWQEINHSKLKQYSSTPPTYWFDHTWHQQTPLKADVAHALFDRLATFLGSLETTDTPVDANLETDVHTLLAESHAVLNSCAIPSTWHRHWLAYSATSLALLAGYLHVKKKLSGQALFEIKDQQDLKLLVNQIPTPDTSQTYLDTYRYCKKANSQFIEVAKKDAAAVRAFLEERKCEHVAERTPGIRDFSTKLYNENGVTHARHWFREHCVKPCKDLWAILFTDKHRTDMTILASDIQHFEKNWQTGLDELITHAQQCPEQDVVACVTRIAGTTPIEALSFNQKRAIHTELLFYFSKNFHADSMRFLNQAYDAAQVNPEERGRMSKIITGGLEYLDPKLNMYGTLSAWIPTVGKLLEKLKTEQAAPTSPLGLLTSTLALAGLEKTLQINSLLNAVGNVADAQKLTFATMATIPIGLMGYIAYKTSSVIVTKITKRTFIEPLKHDLLSLQCTLNNHRYQDDLDVYTKGVCRYFTHRLTQYSKKLKTKERPRYVQYVTSLSNHTLTPEQHIQTIECMFKEFSFLR